MKRGHLTICVQREELGANGRVDKTPDLLTIRIF